MRKSIETDIEVLDILHEVLLKMEWMILEQACYHDPVAVALHQLLVR